MTMKLYTELAPCYPLLDTSADHAEEAAFYGDRLAESGDDPARTLLELGGHDCDGRGLRYLEWTHDSYPG